jgi:Glycosyl transferase family 2
MTEVAHSAPLVQWLPAAAAARKEDWGEARVAFSSLLEDISKDHSHFLPYTLLLAYSLYKLKAFQQVRQTLQECESYRTGTTTLGDLIEPSYFFGLRGMESALWWYLTAESMQNQLSALSASITAVERLQDYLIGVKPYLETQLENPFIRLPAQILVRHARRATEAGHSSLAEAAFDLSTSFNLVMEESDREQLSHLAKEVAVAEARTWSRRVEAAVDHQFFPQIEVRVLNKVSQTEPRVSVCLPSYNEGEWLRITIDSLLENARYENVEILIALQHSGDTDESGLFLNEPTYRNEKRIRVLHYEHPLGVNAARYELGVQASGEILCFLDSHAIISKSFIQNAAEIFFKNRAVSMLAPPVTPLSSDNQLERPILTESLGDLSGLFSMTYLSDLPRTKATKNLYMRPSLLPGAVFLSTEVFARVGALLKVLPTHPRAMNALARAAYLHGFEIYLPLTLSCILKMPRGTSSSPEGASFMSLFPSHNPDLFRETVYLVYLFFSAQYFQNEFAAELRKGGNQPLRAALDIIEENKEMLQSFKRNLWRGACRSHKHYWDQFGEEVVENLSPSQYARLVV